MPRVTIDRVQAALEQVKVVPPKEKKKRAPPPSKENDKKHQRMTIAILNNKIKNLTQVNHAL